MATQLSRQHEFDQPAIPNRLYFKIGDVARLCGVETYVLRFWETQFPQLKPNKSGTGQRLYRRRDVEMALEIKRLVHAEGYTLSGARQLLEQSHRPGPRREQQNPSLLPAASESERRMDAVAAAIGHARAELRGILDLLAAPNPRPPRRKGRLASIQPPAEMLFPS